MQNGRDNVIPVKNGILLPKKSSKNKKRQLGKANPLLRAQPQGL
jgi:hypothetical protein